MDLHEVIGISDDEDDVLRNYNNANKIIYISIEGQAKVHYDVSSDEDEEVEAEVYRSYNLRNRCFGPGFYREVKGKRKEKIDVISDDDEVITRNKCGKKRKFIDDDDQWVCRKSVADDVGGSGSGSGDKVIDANANAPFSASQAKSIENFIWNTIWQETVLSNDDNNEPVQLKFKYGIEEPEKVEKSDDEKLIDSLWDEYDFVLASSRIGSFSSSAPAVETEVVDEPNAQKDSSSHCRQGYHDLILDDQVGVKCRCCPFVQLEIKYVLPPISTRRSSGRRAASKEYADTRNIGMWEAFDYHDANGKSQGFTFHGKGTVWDIFPQIQESMRPHQKEGFEFLWKNLAGGIEIETITKSPAKNDIGGCVISHAPGTGKTYLTIAFLRCYMEIFKECRPVIIAPSNLLLTWEDEFKKWEVDIPFYNLNVLDFTGEEDEMICKMVHGKPKSTKLIRMMKLFSWGRQRSVLGISYSLFQRYVGKGSVKGNEKKEIQSEITFLDEDEKIEAEQLRRILLEKPSLVVLDEGHTPRNKDSNTLKALENIKTNKCIILSGTLFQNNFDELYTTLCLARPKFADKFFAESTTTSQQVRQDTRGRWTSLMSSVGKHKDKASLDGIRSLIGSFVHVCRENVLKESLPGLRECVVVLEPLPLQRKLLKGIRDIQNQLEFEHAVAIISIHPSLLTNSTCVKDDKNCMEKITLADFRLDCNEGVKTRFLMELIRLSEVLKEKVLVFSQFIEPLLLIKEQIHHHFEWTEGQELLQMDGDVPMKHRQPIINLFNDPGSNVKVLLASTKCCGEGISLNGASRVVLLDVVWNPSVERQAIGRAYRMGQKRVVYTYHLITSGTIEEEKYDRQVQKDRLSELLFPGDTDKQKDPLTKISDDTILEEMVGNKKLQDILKETYVPAERNT
ncbi:Snf2 domain-containing protein classy [Thalictrum thalictroides]|uniref:Snf2 domain-containing protein classy n=1 Tax=Thalictrum thalictroides TaxID=46969 RepID=A0A7J6WVA4_THATH|nr:Snf2 domain-containing protein classy [Thalictrum thalictroides]